MDSRQELFMGKLAVALKIITKEQLKNCLELQKEKPIPLPLLLIKQKMLLETQIPLLLQRYFQEIQERELLEPGENLAFCYTAKKIMALKTLQDAVLTQRRSQHPISLAQVLLQKQALSPLHILEVYIAMDKATLACPGCKKYLRMIRLSPGKKLRCKNCKTLFEVPTPESMVGVTLPPQDLEAESKPTTFGEYEVINEIAEGGMGVIYRAQKKTTGQVVALKVLGEAQRASPEAQERFRRESFLLKQKLSNHKNIVNVFDVGIENGAPYFAMEFIDGKPLSELIEGHPLPLERSIAIFTKICEAIQYAHSKDVIHRDIKPSNILLDANDEPHVTDFGLAKCKDSMTFVTRSGALLGTTFYMSPEQAKGKLGLITHRSDIYSLGVVLYEMLTGKKPFVGETSVEIYQKILTTNPIPPSQINPEVPKEFDKICAKCMDKNPFHRYKSVEDLSKDVKNFGKKKESWWSSLFKKK